MLVCLAVCRAYPTLGTSDRVLSDALTARGARVSALAWNDAPLADVLAHDAIVLRATWDYQDDMPGYDAWTRAMEAAGARVFNDPALARLYARIDGVLRGERPVSTEVELTDPWLHFDRAPQAAELMADAIVARLRAETRP